MFRRTNILRPLVFTYIRSSMSHKYPAGQPKEQWKNKLTTEEYEVLFEKATERRGTGEYNKYYPQTGYFKCRACDNPLYSAGSKFDSGCGWPAFDKCYEGSVRTEADYSWGVRIEILCANCGGHLGHVFEGERMTDTNERHCVNSVSVKYDPGNISKAEKKVL